MTDDLDKARNLLRGASMMPAGLAGKEAAVREATAWALIALADAAQQHVTHEYT